MTLIDFNIHCVGCGLNLRTCDSQAACPRCGQAVAETLVLALVDPADLRINGDLSCVGCGYNLRTLHTNAVCPECGKPIAPTLAPDPLRRAGRDWLSSMRRGMNLLSMVTLFLVAFQIATDCVAYSFFSIGSGYVGRLFYLIMQICYILLCVGVCWSTRPEPSQDGWLGTGNWRAWARVMAIAMVVCHLFLYFHLTVWNWWSTGLVSFWPEPSGMSGLGQISVRVIQSAATAAVSAASWILLFAHLRQLTRRAGRKVGLLTVLIYLFGLYGIVQVVQNGPVYFLMMCESYQIWPSVNVLGRHAFVVWRFIYFVQTLSFAVIMIPAAVVFLRCSRMFKAAAEGRSDRRGR